MVAVMKVLHICSDFSGSKVHQNLFKSLEKLGITQEVYCYFIEKKYEGRNFFESDVTSIHYACILNKYDRYFYHYKGCKVTRDLKKRIDVSKIDITHATTLFSDGSVAYRLFKKYHIPYIVTVRNSDINIHLKRALHEWPNGKQILQNAEKIVFISEALRHSFCEHSYIKRFLSEIERKIVVQPNGIDDYWLDNSSDDRVIAPDNHKLIYVGVYDQNKNIYRLTDAVLSLKKKYSDISLTLVGGRGKLKNQIKELAEVYKDVLDYKGLVTDRSQLRNMYQLHSVFVMPSIHETFGLVYIEAMSQGLACVFTRGQGIDGMFPNEIGEAVDPFSVEDIARKIDKIFSNREKYSTSAIDFEQFRWKNISLKYLSIYDSILKRKHENC